MADQGHAKGQQHTLPGEAAEIDVKVLLYRNDLITLVADLQG